MKKDFGDERPMTKLEFEIRTSEIEFLNQDSTRKTRSLDKYNNRRATSYKRKEKRNQG